MNDWAVFGTRTDNRETDVWRKLGRVTDPELDESVTDMGFVTDVELGEDGSVAIAFRLPTYWCSPNFAYMMGEDMRTAVLELEWVRSASVTLGEHMYVDAINAGVNSGLRFSEAMGAEATGDLDELRRTFELKAFQWRQEVLLSHLLKAGQTPEALVALTVGGLYGWETTIDTHRLVSRYLDRRHVPASFDDASLAFIDADGKPLRPQTLNDYLRSIRRIRTNAEFNGALCRGLLAERYNFDPLAPAPAPSGSCRTSV